MQTILNQYLQQQKVLKFNQPIQNSLFKSFEATVSDNPTELTYSDIIGVVRELRTNNAYEFLEGVGGEDKIGKKCAEVKSFLIDLELPLAA